VASSKREKELARQRAVRQAARNSAATKKRKQRNAIVASVVAVLLVAVVGVGTALALRGNGGGNATAAGATPGASTGATPAPSPQVSTSGAPSPAASASAGATTVSCTYTKSSDKPAREVKLPPTTGVETTKVYDVTIKTNQGTIAFRMDSAKAPCTDNNLRSLAHFAYYDDTPCHRLTTEGIYVLQCGDPTGTGSGGPGYSFPDENLKGATYPRGTVAMANAGPDTNGSQFFLVYKDSTSLPANFTPFGKITKGLDVLDKVAKAGSDNSNRQGDGKPKLPVQIQTLRAEPAA